MSSSKEKLSKLSKAVSNLDPKVVVKDFWHVQCSCGTAVKLNHEFSVVRFEEHRRHSCSGLHRALGQMGITSFFKPTGVVRCETVVILLYKCYTKFNNYCLTSC